jgi:hypothetical protein
VLAPQTFESVYSYLAGLTANERNEFYAIIPLYLDAKRAGVAVEGSVLNIFSFLEARDGSRTMSWQTLQTMLNLTRDEAEFIVAVRNAFGHGRKILSAAIVDERHRIVNSAIFAGVRSRYPEIEFFLCLMKVLDAYMCGLFGVRTNDWQYAPAIESIREA